MRYELMISKAEDMIAGKISIVGPRFTSRVLPWVVLVVLSFQSSGFLAAQIPLLSGIRKARIESQQLRADYPGPVRYSPSDPEFRSKLFRLQTGHAGLFYNCDGEESKRNSPYICWNSQHSADWRNGACEACRRDRADVRQRLVDGSCCSEKKPDCQCDNCLGASVVHDDVLQTEFEGAPGAPTEPQLPVNELTSPPAPTGISRIISSWGDQQPEMQRPQHEVVREGSQPRPAINRVIESWDGDKPLPQLVVGSKPMPIQRTATLRPRNWTGKIATQDLVVRPLISLVEAEAPPEPAPEPVRVSERVSAGAISLPVIR